MAASGPFPTFSSNTRRPRSSAQRRLTAVGRVLPSSSETSWKRAASRAGSRSVRRPSTSP